MNKRELKRLKRHNRIKMRMHGTAKIPRLVVRRSLLNLSAQVIDDASGKTLFSLSTGGKENKKQFAKGAGNLKTAQEFGILFAQKAREKGFAKIIFDRAGYLYHGRVKTFAEALRKGGLEF